jgi:hypothetical protein
MNNSHNPPRKSGVRRMAGSMLSPVDALPPSAPAPVDSPNDLGELLDTVKLNLFAPPEEIVAEDHDGVDDDHVFVTEHSCRYGGIRPCKCKKLVSRAEAKKKVEIGEADWAKDQSAITLRRGGGVRSSNLGGTKYLERLLHDFGKTEAPPIPRHQTTLWNGKAGELTNTSLLLAIRHWPEFSGIDVSDVDWRVWEYTAALPAGDPDNAAMRLQELATALDTSLAELDAIYRKADRKISARYAECRQCRSGVFAHDFGIELPLRIYDLQIDVIEKGLRFHRQLIATLEFNSLDETERVALAAWVEARMNYKDASAASGVNDATLSRRVKSALKTLRGLNQNGQTKSKQFADLFDIPDLTDVQEEQAQADDLLIATKDESRSAELSVHSAGERFDKKTGKFSKRPLDTFELRDAGLKTIKPPALITIWYECDCGERFSKRLDRQTAPKTYECPKCGERAPETDPEERAKLDSKTEAARNDLDRESKEDDGASHKADFDLAE